MNRECNVTKRVQTEKGLRYCPVVLSANGRIKPDVVLVNGKRTSSRKCVLPGMAQSVNGNLSGKTPLTLLHDGSARKPS